MARRTRRTLGLANPPSSRAAPPARPATRGQLMTAGEYRAALERLGFTRASAGRFFRVASRTAQVWGTQGPPPPVAVAVILMLALEVPAGRADALVASYTVPWPKFQRP